MNRAASLLLAAVLVATGGGGATGKIRAAVAQVVDTSGRAPPAAPRDTGGGAAHPDSTRRDTTRDTIPHVLPVLPPGFPEGPLPAGTRYTFTADSFAFSDKRTLSDLLSHIPGVFVARTGLFGQPEAVMYAGHGAAGLELYWDGVPYLPLGRDSVFVDPARVPLAPLERVDVIVLPSVLRVYLTSLRQRSTAPASEVGITTGVVGTAGYRGEFLKRWRSGLGLSVVADWNDIAGVSGTASTAFHDVDLWFKGEFIPTPRAGVVFQILSSDWDRRGATSPTVLPISAKREADVLSGFYATRSDGLGQRVELSLATSSLSHDSAVVSRSLGQGMLTLSSLWPRASVQLLTVVQGDPNPFALEVRTGWMPFHFATLSVDARHASYQNGRNGNRAHASVGLNLPLGFRAHGDVAWADDYDAPARLDDSMQTTTDLYGAVTWTSRLLTFEIGGARRDPFKPVADFPDGFPGISGLGLTPATNYVVLEGAIRPLPGLELSGWYWNPVRGGGDFEPPTHARYSVTFYSKFWRTYRSGIFAVRAELAEESWSGGGGAGIFTDSSGVTTALALPPGTFMNLNAQIRVGGVTIFWSLRNARAFHGGYVPDGSYPSNYQVYGVRWHFTN